MELIKIYDKTCPICLILAGIDEQVAEDYNMFFRQMTIEECAKNPSHIRDYVVANHVSNNDIAVPLYLVSTQQGRVLGGSFIKTIEELENFIGAALRVKS